MRIILSILLLSVCYPVTVDGYAYLENQTDHSGINVLFERTVPSALTETATTDANGLFTAQLETGIYDVTYSKVGYFYMSLSDQSLYANTTLSNVTLLEHTTILSVPSVFATIQDALNSAFEGDTVLVSAGTYTENITWPATNGIKLIGNGAEDCFIDGGQQASVIRFEEDLGGIIDTTTLITGFTIQNGRQYNDNSDDYYGGGMHLYDSSPTLMNMTISGNTAKSGGGMYISRSSLALTDVTFIGNTGVYFGGGMYISSSSPTLTGVTFIGNSAYTGGGMYILSILSNPTLTGVTFIGNSAEGNGGGMYMTNSSNATLTGVTFSYNSTGWAGQYKGGGIYVVSGNHAANLSITYSNLYNNDGDNCYNCGEWVGNNLTVNANADSCDAYYNISLDPLFCDPTNGDFTLAETSPLIGAGENGNNIGALGVGCVVPDPIVRNVPSEYSTIQSALNAASEGDTVLVQPDTYYENIFWPETNGIKLISAGDSSNTVIDGGGISLVIYMNPQTATIDTTTEIQGFKITNGGNVSSGGGFYINNASPKIIDLIVSDNVTYNGGGGGIYVSNSNLILKNVTVRNNIADGGPSGNNNLGRGGGILIEVNSTPSLNNVVISGNSANFGGGIYQVDNSPFANLTNVMIKNNIVSASPNYCFGQGGGIYMSSKIYMENVSVINNSACGGGGGIFWQPNGADTLSNVIISGNSTTGEGGGILTYSTSSSTITNVQVINNTAVSSGGGMKLASIYKISNTLIYNNKTTYPNYCNGCDGGGANIYSGDVIIDSTIIVNNSSNSNGGGLYKWGGGSITYNFVTIVGNTGFDGAGIYNSSTANLNNVTIVDNQGTGTVDGIINVDENNSDGVLTVSGSNIAHNGQSIYNEDISNFVVATNNFWGHSSGPYHPSQNPTGQGDSTNAFVNVTPWLTEPNTDAPPIPPQNLTVTGNGDVSVDLTWNASLMGDLAGYKVYYDTDSSGYPYANSIDVSTNITHTLSSLSAGTTYYVAVTTFDADGNESWYSNELILNSGCTTTTACNYDANSSFGDNCTYAVEYYDCDGDCLTDTDADTICDELEVSGCTGATACNYSASATDDDGSCEYCSCQTCSEHGTCVDTGSNYTCTCNGYYSGTTCETDIDECATGNGGCNANATCTNNDGAIATCICNDGYSGEGTTCVDIDECATDNGGCGEATCVNNEGIAPTCSELSLFNGLIPEVFSIHSIYPNPFNPVTNITYGLPEHVNVQILVYDLSGKQVETLINESQAPGYHSVNWNADNLPSGVYLIRMESGEFTQIQKLMLVK